jgi:hypothetical protein
MEVDNSDAGQTGNPSHLETQAFRLWTFVHRRASGFSRVQALATLRELEPTDHDEIKPFAKRLQRALETHRVKIAHTAALQAAALVLQGQDWHKIRQGQLVHTLKLLSLTEGPDELIADWHHAGQRLVAICEEWVQRHPAIRAFQIQTTPATFVVSALEIAVNQESREWPAIPIAVISPHGNADDRWLTGVGSCLERLHRRLEETYLAALDGLAVLDFDDSRTHSSLGLPSIAAGDAHNTELVLTREDNPLMPGSGYEIVRGDELACWMQFDLARKGEAAVITVDDDGGWTCGDARFVWSMVTLQPKEFIPGLTTHLMGPSDASKLLRRYRLAKRILGRSLPQRTGRKRLIYPGGPAETYRMDLHRLLLAMNEAGLTWEGYCDEAGEPGRAMVSELPLGFVLPLLARLDIDDPDSVFARPARADLARADDDSVLRALMPRVDHVRYRTCEGITPGARQIVREAIVDLRTSILMRAGAFQIDEPLPDLVYGSDGEELMAKLEELGLVAYVGVLPHFRKFPEDIEPPSGSWPYAFGHSLYLEIELRGA